ncbi:hypothetical protein [Plesiomonas shigelloides]|nr:hypothetical protein [Plesiomonas shigelloides]MBW3793560.1 hypothetical protein [Plesiomonas shigelloides]
MQAWQYGCGGIRTVQPNTGQEYMTNGALTGNLLTMAAYHQTHRIRGCEH